MAPVRTRFNRAKLQVLRRVCPQRQRRCPSCSDLPFGPRLQQCVITKNSGEGGREP